MDLTSPSLFKPTSNRAQISPVLFPPRAAASPSRRANSEEHQPWVAGVLSVLNYKSKSTYMKPLANYVFTWLLFSPYYVTFYRL